MILVADAFAAPPPDVRKVFDLPSSNLNSFQGCAPMSLTQVPFGNHQGHSPYKSFVGLTEGRRRRRPSAHPGGGAARRK